MYHHKLYNTLHNTSVIKMLLINASPAALIEFSIEVIGTRTMLIITTF